MHPGRITARRKVDVARAAMKTAEKQAEIDHDATAFLASVSAWQSSLADLVTAEINHPTPRESRRRADRLRLENMGLGG